jgi:hypothetical protein
MQRRLRIAIFLVSITALLPAVAKPLRVIEMDGPASTLLPADPKRPMVGPTIIEKRAAKSISTTVDLGTKYAIWRTTESYEGGHGLALRIDRELRSPSEPTKSKIEINVARHDDSDLDAASKQRFILRNGVERFLGFAFKLDRDGYETPSRWVLHFQVWQCCSLLQPPLVLQAIPAPLSSAHDDPVQFVVLKRTDGNLGKEPTWDNGDKLRLLDGNDTFGLQRGRWYRFIFRLMPGTHSAAAVSMWLDGKLLLEHRGPWGYSPLTEASRQDTYAVKLGIYRHAQNRAHQIYLDSIRWGLSREDVDPDKYNETAPKG